MSTTEEQKSSGNGAAPPEPARPAPQPAGQAATRRNRRPRVVIVGAGFGGLNAARALARSPARVLVLDRNNYHGFWPLLYQVATAGLEPESIGYPVRGILRKYHNVGFRMTEVQKVDLERRLVLCERGTPVAYDYLILAAGSTNNYFGNQSLAEHTYPIKDIDEAERLRNRVLSVFEQAVVEPDPARRATLLTFVIIGGGPTGVELAGAFAELLIHVLRHDYPMLDVAEARVVLVEATDKILTVFPPDLQKSALRRLTQMGVEVMLNSPVETVEPDRVNFKDGSSLDAATVIWTAGVRGATLGDTLGVALGKSARVKVTPYLNLPDHPEVFVVGDMAVLETYKDGQAYPMVAQVAMQQADQAAANILAHLRGEPPAPFHYFDKGTMATIGRRAALMDAFGIQLTGFPAWLGWLALHLYYLIGFRNRLVVLANWAYNYFTYDRAVRVIMGRR